MMKNLISDFIIGTLSHNEQFSYIREFDSEQTWLFKMITLQRYRLDRG